MSGPSVSSTVVCVRAPVVCFNCFCFFPLRRKKTKTKGLITAGTKVASGVKEFLLETCDDVLRSFDLSDPWREDVAPEVRLTVCYFMLQVIYICPFLVSFFFFLIFFPPFFPRRMHFVSIIVAFSGEYYCSTINPSLPRKQNADFAHILFVFLRYR